VTGYWFLDRPSDWQPPVDLEKFLQAGPYLVYAGIGSTLKGDAQKMTALVVDALPYAKQRGLLVT
jgi:sterol 3beta-glucosyltransferase